MRINTKKIKSLNPCSNRLDNWLLHYENFNKDISSFLDLEEITIHDKIWVAVRLLSRESLEIFAIDCAVGAQRYAAADADVAAAYAADAAYADDAAYAADAAADAADVAAYAADVAAYAADADADVAAERKNQIKALKWLFKNEGKKK